MEKGVLKVLLVEDSERDEALLRRHLERSGYELDLHRVETAEHFTDALNSGDWDLILSDYSLPTFNALSALFLLKSSDLDIPFIIISGTIGEEVAVEAMRLGANDYLMKDNLARLEPAIGRELEDTRNRREKREAQESKLQSLAQLAEAQRLTHIGSWTWDLVADQISWSEELFRIFGLEPAEKAPSYAELQAGFFHADDIQFVENELQTAFASGSPFNLFCRLYRPDGTMRHLHAIGRGLTDAAGKALKYYGTAQDVTEEKEAEERLEAVVHQLEHQTQRLQDIVDKIPGVVWEAAISPDGKRTTTFLSDHVEKLLGYSVEEWTASPDFGKKVMHPDDRDRVERELQALLQNSEDSSPIEFRWISKDGSPRWVQSKVAAIRDANGTAVGLRGVTVDITERKKAEATVRESERQYRLLFESNPIPMWVYDLETLRFLEVNDAAINHYGYSRDEFIAMKITDIRSKEESELLLKEVAAIEGPMSGAKVWRHRKKDGREIFVEVTAHSLDFEGHDARLVLANDISERQVLEDQLRQAQKMEAIGVLAGGIAHDFNNLLTVINGYADLILLGAPEDSPFLRNLQDIREAGERAADLTRQLLAFSRKQVLDPKILDLAAVVSNLERMLKRIIGENIDFRTIVDEDLRHVNADPGQIEQILMNLVVNARDAMPHGGKLTIEVHNVELDDEYARRHISVKPGRYVMLAVSDTGTGMDEATKQRIFEPFFSTKQMGHGTGLGLSMIYGIVKQSGGNIWVYSEPGRGSTFKVYLPSVDSEITRSSENSVNTHLRGAETILLVEDEDLVRKLTKDILELFGYQVLTSANGAEALGLCGTLGDTIDLLITDVIMPGMSGRELAQKIHLDFPDMKVLYISGYTDDAIVHQGIIDADAHFVQKPFRNDVLLQKVRELLDAERL